jgi:type I restriction enzyme, S subunit
MKWPLRSIGEVCDVISGSTPKTGNPDYWGGTIPWATPKDLSVNNSKYLSDTPRKITDAGLKSCAAKMLPPYSVLFSSRAPIGLVAINTMPVCTNQGFKNMVPRESLISSDYLFWWLKLNRIQIDQLGRGATFKEVSKKIIEDIQLPLPPLQEQRRIAKILDAADALRAKRRESLAQLDALIQSTFLDMFGDPVTNPKGWEIRAFKNTRSKVQIGPFGSLLHKEDYIHNGIPLVNPMHIVSGTIQVGIEQTISETKAKELINYRIKNGDVIMGRRGEMGRCAIVTENEHGFLCGTGSLFVRPHQEELTSVFIANVLSSEPMKKNLEALSQGVTMPNLNRTMIEWLRIPLPPLDLQHHFASIIESIERQKVRLRSHLTELDTLFASLQHRAFNGEL